MKHDIESRDDLEQLVRIFYDKVRSDAELAPIFNSIITDWEPHLQKITDFWEQHLFGVQKYKGNPIEVHNKVDARMKNNVTAHNFGTWLFYWMQTLDELFEGPNKEVLKFKARKMQTVFFVNIVQARSKT
ncbi:group III truncated hemoglobin [Paenimyroides aestuarii]|uniref:Group III truncated hemoglobin n=1 Tax=Paenimyroides aestuarii TaxID=2968490 RepID=A0ABY5NPE5_9FLAO|nr:group III truncated hemoglobin [Paenimyroides aestuarii]UUV20421.1 group III truncated hemoglobin [Paenimyroides aestuarii]